MIMAVAGLAIFGTACSSDDNSVTDTPEVVEETKTLKLTSDKLEVTIGDEIKFNVTDGKNAVADVVITEVGGGTIAQGVWKAVKAGTFKFMATKVGYEKSNEITVVVKEAEKEVANAIKVGDDLYSIDSAMLMAETMKDPEGTFIRLYSTVIDNEEVFFCRFLMDVRTENFDIVDKKPIGAIARVFKVVIQDMTQEKVILPGMDLESDINVNGWILSDKGEVDFEPDDVTNFDVKLTGGMNDGGKTVLTVKNESGLVDYSGEFKSLGIVDTSNTPDSKGMKTKYKKTKAIEVSSFTEGVNFSNFKVK